MPPNPSTAHPRTAFAGRHEVPGRSLSTASGRPVLHCLWFIHHYTLAAYSGNVQTASISKTRPHSAAGEIVAAPPSEYSYSARSSRRPRRTYGASTKRRARRSENDASSPLLVTFSNAARSVGQATRFGSNKFASAGCTRSRRSCRRQPDEPDGNVGRGCFTPTPNFPSTNDFDYISAILLQQERHVASSSNPTTITYDSVSVKPAYQNRPPPAIHFRCPERGYRRHFTGIKRFPSVERHLYRKLSIFTSSKYATAY